VGEKEMSLPIRAVLSALLVFIALGMLVGPAISGSRQNESERIQIQAVPKDVIYLNKANDSVGYYDFVIHSLSIWNTSSKPIQIDTIRVSLMKGGVAVEQRAIDIRKAIGDSNSMEKLAASPYAPMLKTQFLNENGLQGIVSPNTEVSQSELLEPNTVLAVLREYFLTSAEIDEVNVVVTGSDANQQTVLGTLSLDIIAGGSSIEYALPVEGDWLAYSLPMLQSHHRWIPSIEHAIDFRKSTPISNASLGRAGFETDTVGYGQGVFAAADGEVVFTINDQEDSQSRLNDNRSAEEQQVAQAELFSTDIRRATAGNTVTIRHEKAGQVEFSSYGHLRKGSVLVKPGTRVFRGQKIAEVGDSGSTKQVHLHFQVGTSSDAFLSQTIPINFAVLNNIVASSEPGVQVVGASRDP
jgi:biotin carboxyl carrier protein